MSAAPPLPDGSTLKTYCIDIGHDPNTVTAQAIFAAVMSSCSMQDMTDRITAVDGAVVCMLDVASEGFVRYQDSSVLELFINEHGVNHPLPAQVNAALSNCLHTTTGYALSPAEFSNDQELKLLLIILVCATIDVACVILWKGIIRRNRTIMIAWNPDVATRLQEDA
jgi:hypothetical protein